MSTWAGVSFCSNPAVGSRLTAGPALTVVGACSSRLIRLFLAEPTLLLSEAMGKLESLRARGAGQVVIMRIRLVPADALTVYGRGVSFG